MPLRFLAQPAVASADVTLVLATLHPHPRRPFANVDTVGAPDPLTVIVAEAVLLESGLSFFGGSCSRTPRPFSPARPVDGGVRVAHHLHPPCSPSISPAAV